MTLLARQFRVLRASWATWVLAGFALFFAVLAPVTATFMPEILGSLAGGEIPIDVSALPNPTAADAWVQWSSNLNQIIIILVAIVAASTISADIARGSAVPILARPVSRTWYWGSAFLAVTVAVTLITVVSTALMTGVTALLLDVSPTALRTPALATAAWLLFACSLIAVTLLASSLGAPTLGAAAAGVGWFALTALAGLWTASHAWSPTGLLTLEPTWGAAAVTALVTAGMVAAGLAAFRRREI